MISISIIWAWFHILRALEDTWCLFVYKVLDLIETQGKRTL
jgi:hypothetical protein